MRLVHDQVQLLQAHAGSSNSNKSVNTGCTGSTGACDSTAAAATDAATAAGCSPHATGWLLVPSVAVAPREAVSALAGYELLECQVRYLWPIITCMMYELLWACVSRACPRLVLASCTSSTLSWLNGNRKNTTIFPLPPPTPTLHLLCFTPPQTLNLCQLFPLVSLLLKLLCCTGRL